MFWRPNNLTLNWSPLAYTSYSFSNSSLSYIIYFPPSTESFPLTQKHALTSVTLKIKNTTKHPLLTHLLFSYWPNFLFLFAAKRLQRFVYVCSLFAVCRKDRIYFFPPILSLILSPPPHHRNCYTAGSNNFHAAKPNRGATRWRSGKESNEGVLYQWRSPKRRQFEFLGREGLLEEGATTHSSILAWRIQWTEESGGLQCMGSQRVGSDWASTHANQTSNYRPSFNWL